MEWEIHLPSDILSPSLAAASSLNPEKALGLAPKRLLLDNFKDSSILSTGAS